MFDIPTPGRIVRFRTSRGHVVPAIITEVYEDGTVDLTAFGMRFAYGSEAQGRVPYEAPFTNGTDYRWWWNQDENITEMVPEGVAVEEPITQEAGQKIVDDAVDSVGSA